MVNNHSRLIMLLSLMVSAFSTPVQAAEESLKVMMPWDGEGTVHSIGTDKMLFMGEFEGVMYAESATGELDAAFASCPANQHIDLKSGETSGSGYCNITISAEETVFAEWSCTGKVGSCTGTFTLTGGTGRFEGVTGSSELVVRSVLNALVIGMGSGSPVRAASGLAVLPKLTYKLASTD